MQAFCLIFALIFLNTIQSNAQNSATNISNNNIVTQFSGLSITLQCNLAQFFTQQSIIWLASKDGVTLFVIESILPIYVIDSQFNLTIFNLNQNDNNRYYACGFSPLSISPLFTALNSYSLFVKELPILYISNGNDLMLESSVTNFTYGNTYKLSCVSISSGIPVSLTLYGDNLDLSLFSIVDTSSSCDANSVYTNGILYTLAINDARLAKISKITCEALNKTYPYNLNTSRSVNVSIIIPQTNISIDLTKTVIVTPILNSTVTLTCNSNQNGIIWLQYDLQAFQIISNTSTSTYSINQKNSLTIKNIDFTNVYYICGYSPDSNSFIAFSIYFLIVEQPPTILIGFQGGIINDTINLKYRNTYQFVCIAQNSRPLTNLALYANDINLNAISNNQTVVINRYEYTCDSNLFCSSSLILTLTLNDIRFAEIDKITCTASNTTYPFNLTTSYSVDAKTYIGLDDITNNLNSYLNQTSAYTNFNALIQVIGDSLSTTSSSINSRANLTILNNFFNLVSQSLKLPKSSFYQSQVKSNTSSKIIIAASNMLSLDLQSKFAYNASYENIQVASFNILDQQSNYRIGVALGNSNTLQPLYNNTSSNAASVYLNMNSIKSLGDKASDLRLSVIFYSTNSLFQKVDQYQPNSNCQFTSSQVISVSTNMIVQPTNTNLVTLSFPSLEISNNSCASSGSLTYSCVFWNFSLNSGYGDWSALGCSLTLSSSTYICSCSHTTNFAILITNSTLPPICSWCDSGMFYSSLVGSSVAIILLVVTSLNLIAIERKNNQKDKLHTFSGLKYYFNKLLIVVCFNLTILNTFYIVFSAAASNIAILDVASCKAIGIILHFFLLASFFTLSVMLILRYMLLTDVVFAIVQNFLFISILTSYGLSAIVIIINMVVSTGPSKYVSEEICWLTDTNDLLSVYIPLAFSILIGLIFLGLLIYEMTKTQAKYKNIRERKKKGFEMYNFIFATIFICGLTWLFGFLVIIPPPINILYLRFVFSIIFCLLNVVQGLVIFVWSINLHRLKSDDELKLTDAFAGSSQEFDFNKTIVLDNKPHSLVRFGASKNIEKTTNEDFGKKE